ncbi:TPA: hypothetical protein N0F65_002198, partial [Lagenidium giganteum]
MARVRNDGNGDDDVEQFLINALKVLGDWSAHDDEDGHVFYYNRATKESVWQPPKEFEQHEGDVMMQLMTQHALARSGPWSAHDAGNGTIYYFNQATRVSVWERPADWGTYMDPPKEEPVAPVVRDAVSEKNTTKRDKKQQQKKNNTTTKTDEKPTDGPVKAESRAEPEAAVAPQLTLEEQEAQLKRAAEQQKQIESFRQMLREKKIMPFCQWSVAFPRIAMDPRFIAVPSMEQRRMIFEDFVKNRPANLKAEKKEKLKKAKKAMTKFLCEHLQGRALDNTSTLTVFLAAMEKREEDVFAQLKADALDLLPVAEQEKIWTKAVRRARARSHNCLAWRLVLMRSLCAMQLSEVETKRKLGEEQAAAWESLIQSKTSGGHVKWDDERVQQWRDEFAASLTADGDKKLELTEIRQREIFLRTMHAAQPVAPST